MCRSAEYNYVTLQCRLGDVDRRTLRDGRPRFRLTQTQGVDYFENLCMTGEDNMNIFNGVSRGIPIKDKKGISLFNGDFRGELFDRYRKNCSGVLDLSIGHFRKSMFLL